MATNHETAPRIELDNETAFEVAWGMITNRIAEVSVEHDRFAPDSPDAQAELDRIRKLIDFRDGLSPDNREALDVVMTLVPVLTESQEPART